MGGLRELLDEVQGSSVGLTSGDLLGDVAGLQQVISAGSAVQAVRLAQFAARGEVRDEGGAWVEVDLGVGHVADFRADDAAPVVGLSPGMAQRRVSTVARLASVLPTSLRALADGVLDPFRVQIIAEETLLADRETCAAVEEQVFPVDPEVTPGALRSRVRRGLALVDPELVARQAKRARAQLFVHVRSCEVPGVSEWFARLSSEDSVLCWAAIDELGHQAKAEDPTRSIDQCRAQALADLILSRSDVTAHVIIPVPVHHDTRAPAHAHSQGQPSGSPQDPSPVSEKAPGRPVKAGATSDHGRGHEQCDGVGAERQSVSEQAVPDVADVVDVVDTSPQVGRQPGTAEAAFFGTASGVQIPGIGIIQGEVADQLLARFGTTLTGMLIDADTGVTIATTATAYRPSAKIAAFVRLRDGTCRFPGCAAGAKRCELDHVIPWEPHAGPEPGESGRFDEHGGSGESGGSSESDGSGGRTEPNNLICLCRHHHRAKTHARWTPVLDPVTANVTWTDPYGQRWITRPTDHLISHVA